MRPRGRHRELGPPPLQICKGTRMMLREGAWRDMHENDLHSRSEAVEKLIETALREAVEETGLELAHIAALFDLGQASFRSATNGREKHMWLFAALMKGAECLLPMAQVADSTAERKWCTLEEFRVSGRKDHVPIVERAVSLLDGALSLK
jgi:8-oxo-dGTP pyrophosphatase MutT (NUDIX family)